MSNDIPITRVAHAALIRAREAQAKVEAITPPSYARDEHEAARRAITGTVELLALICPEPAKTVFEVAPNPATVVAVKVSDAPAEFFAETAPHRDPRDEYVAI